MNLVLLNDQDLRFEQTLDLSWQFQVTQKKEIIAHVNKFNEHTEEAVIIVIDFTLSRQQSLSPKYQNCCFAVCANLKNYDS